MRTKPFLPQALLASLFLFSGLGAQMPDGKNRTAAPTTGGDSNAIVERASRRAALQRARVDSAARAKAALLAKGGRIDPATFGQNPEAAIVQASLGIPLAKPQVALGLAWTGVAPAATPTLAGQLAQPDYMFGTASNWHNTKPIHKFVDTLPGLGPTNKNNLGNFIPLGVADTTTYPGSDYYRLGVVQYTQQLHSELAATRLRGFKDIGASAEDTQNGGNSSNYLGPFIIAKRDRPVRVQLTNQLPVGTQANPNAGDLFLPVDVTMMGAGAGPLGSAAIGTKLYPQNRALLHLHGGLNPWVSDGTPHQWITPAGEYTSYPKGASFRNVPDMPAGSAGDGIGTYYYTNQQSSRMLWYHDHSFGLTRLNVYAGMAAGYLVVDDTEETLINKGLVPNNDDPSGPHRYGIPLVLQDKTFVNTATLGTLGVMGGTDPTWSVTKYGGDGSLWFPHVYMPNQNPADISGANPMGRWDYGPWFWPPVTSAAGLVHGAVAVPNDPKGTMQPGTPNPSLVPEAFLDTPVVNGVAYPKLTVQPKAYRFRILNASNDRFWNLSFFLADSTGTEVSMVPAAPNSTWPVGWPTDGRDGGVPDPTTAGPSFIQIGNESGFLPTPVVIAPQPVNYNYNRRDIVVLNVQERGLWLGAAERADVIVDFSAYAGKKLILYNDSPAPVPAFDPRLDYYTGDEDQQSTGGAAPTQPGFGPNTRTMMLIEVAAATPDPAFDLNALTMAFTSTANAKGAFAASQEIPIVPRASYNAALNWTLSAANDPYVRIQDTQFGKAFTATESGTSTRPSLLPKAIQELFELDYGRMNATLGVELPLTNFTTQTTVPLGYQDPITETLTDGTTQYWKITHNGVDTHPVHFHLFDVQVVNRVGWDGAVRMPDDNELGWKDTVKMNPLEDIIVAFRPRSPRLPFALPNNLRSPNVTAAATANLTVTNPVDGTPLTTVNSPTSFGWEYVWHCHILGHEENDFMRPMALNVATRIPGAPGTLQATTTNGHVNLSWTDHSTNEVGFVVQRKTATGAWSDLTTTLPNLTKYLDLNVVPGETYSYQVAAYNQAGVSTYSNVVSIGTPTTPVVSGLVEDFSAGSGKPLAGVTMTFTSSNAKGNATNSTSAQGTFAQSLAAGWSGTLTPSLAGYIFKPASVTYSALSTDQLAQNFEAEQIVTVSGTVYLSGVTPLTGLAGVSVAFSNGAGTATTDTNGAYTIQVPKGWSGTATPSKTGYVFGPANFTYTSLVASLTAQNFAATQAYTVSGHVYQSDGATPVPGVVITFGTSGTATSDAAGAYSMTLPGGWTGTATPSLSSHAFTPGSATYTSLAQNQTQDYRFSGATVHLSGTASYGSTPLAGVTVSGGSGYTATTNALGAYDLYLPAPFTGTVTAALAGYGFSPAAYTFTSLSVDTAAQNFSGQPVVTLSGRVTSNALAVSGATLSATGSPSAYTTTTDVNGYYTLVVPSPYTGTLTLNYSNYVIIPASYSYTAITTAQINQNFSALLPVTVTGSVTAGGNALPGVALTFSNNGGTFYTDSTGAYTATLQPLWSGTITPALAGYTFTPTTRTLPSLTTNQVGQNFTAMNSWTVSGTVTNGTTPLKGVVLAFTGGYSATTSATGTYSIALPNGWSGTITPSLRGYMFVGVTVSNLSANQVQNFNTVQVLSGKVQTPSGSVEVAVANATITAKSQPSGTVVATAVSSSTGAFTLKVPTGWTGTVSVSGGGLTTWTPATQSYTNLTTNVTTLLFTGQ